MDLLIGTSVEVRKVFVRGHKIHLQYLTSKNHTNNQNNKTTSGATSTSSDLDNGFDLKRWALGDGPHCILPVSGLGFPRLASGGETFLKLPEQKILAVRALVSRLTSPGKPGQETGRTMISGRSTYRYHLDHRYRTN